MMATIEQMTTLKIPVMDPRPYQWPAFEYWQNRKTPGRAVEVWGRRCGKDLTYASIAACLSFERPGLYLHMLPEFAHARRALWDGMINDGRKFIDVAFPRAIRRRKNDQKMSIELVNGSIWQMMGSDEYNRLVGSNPVFVVFSEWALADPRAWPFISPMLTANGGHAAWISTPRGYNHMHERLEIAKSEPGWRWSVVTSLEAGVMTREMIDAEIRQGMDENLARQEYECDFSAADVASILGKQIEAADKNGRMTYGSIYDSSGAPVVISCDIGYRDTAAFWYWQPMPGGIFHLVDYDEGTGMDADQWIERLQQTHYPLGAIWLPHDARNKTFQSRHSVVERFLAAFGSKLVRVGQAMKSADKINAARTVLPHCHFDAVACQDGITGLRAWRYDWQDDKRTWSREPRHDWASHPADAFCYGAAVMREMVMPAKPSTIVPAGMPAYSLGALSNGHGRRSGRVS